MVCACFTTGFEIMGDISCHDVLYSSTAASKSELVCR